MFKITAFIYLASVSITSTQAFAGSIKSVRAYGGNSSPSYYCGILKAYGQVDLKHCGPDQPRTANLKH